ncbi:hypothetical protein ABZ532_09435 [Streptomyces sp. NPDC019396]|uniref:hypothetical protein n=1 Tax=Streptomyces sp. NPDC019396 TaxID=3154687 RepID=UPI0033F1AE1C
MPVVRSGFSILSEAFAADPYRYFAWLREQAPVHHEAGIDSYFVSRYQDVKRVLTDHEVFTTKTLQLDRDLGRTVQGWRARACMEGPGSPASCRGRGPAPA